MPSPPSSSYISSVRSHSPVHSTPPTSTSPSPAPTTTTPPRPYTDPFDADSDDDHPVSSISPSATAAEHSDFPLLRRTHLTTGYRAGLSAGKEDPEIAQRGFDAGYAIGATLGARVGWVLGALVALKGVAARGGDEVMRTALSERITEVERECSVQLLAEVVEGVKGPQTVEEREEGGDIKALGMMEAERVVRRWLDVVRELCGECGIEMKFPAMRGEGVETKDQR